MKDKEKAEYLRVAADILEFGLEWEFYDPDSKSWIYGTGLCPAFEVAGNESIIRIIKKDRIYPVG